MDKRDYTIPLMETFNIESAHVGESHVSALPTALHRAFRVLYGVDEAFYRLAMEAVAEE